MHIQTRLIKNFIKKLHLYIATLGSILGTLYNLSYIEILCSNNNNNLCLSLLLFSIIGLTMGAIIGYICGLIVKILLIRQPFYKELNMKIDKFRIHSNDV